MLCGMVFLLEDEGIFFFSVSFFLAALVLSMLGVAQG